MIRRQRSTGSDTTSTKHAGLGARVVVWLVLIVGVIGGTVGTMAVSTAEATAQRDAVTGVLIRDESPSGGVALPASTGAAVGDYAQAEGPPPDIDVLRFSPAWRWTNLPMQQDNGADRIIDTVMNAFSSIAFAIGEWFWLLILYMVRLAADGDVLTPAMRAIDVGAVAVASQPLLITAIAIGWLITLWKMGKFALKGNVVKMFSTLVTFLIPIAFLFYISNLGISQAAAGTGGSGQPAYQAPTGSPGWMATWVTDKLDFAGATTVELVDDSITDLTVGSGNSWCAQYVSAMESKVADSDKTATLSAVGSLWQVAYLNNWVNAAFGDSGAGDQVYCYYLDAANNIRPAESQSIQKNAWPTPDPAGGAIYIYEALAEPSDPAGKLSVFSWMACEWNGSGWQMRDDWRFVGARNDGASLNLGPLGGEVYLTDDYGNSFSSGGKEIEYCEKWYQGGDSPVLGPGAPIKDRDELAEYVKIDGKRADSFAGFQNGRVAEITPNAPVARSVADSYLGRNSTIRLGTSLIALVTAGFYGFALIGLSAGALLAQFAVVLLLIFLPLTLILLALGSDKGQKLLRMTVSLLAAKLLFSVLLSVMIAVITLGVALVKPLTESIGAEVVQAGFIQSIAISLVPLGAIWAVRRVAGAAGLGNITSLKGGLGFTMAAAQKAGRSGSLSDITGSKMNDGFLGRQRTRAKDAIKGQATKVGNYPVRSAGRAMERKRLQGNLAAVDAKRDGIAAEIASGRLDGDRLTAAKNKLKGLDAQIKAASDPKTGDPAKLKSLQDERTRLAAEIESGKLDSPELAQKKEELDRLNAIHHSMARRYGHLETEAMLDQQSTMATLGVAGKVAGYGAGAAAVIATGGLAGAALGATGVVSAMTGAAGATVAIGAGGLGVHAHRRTNELTREEVAQLEQQAAIQAEAVAPIVAVSDTRARSAAERDVGRRAAIVAAATPGKPPVVEATAALAASEEVARALGAPVEVNPIYQAKMATRFAEEMGVPLDKVAVSDQGIPVLMPQRFSAEERMMLRPDVAARPEFGLLGGNLAGGLALAEGAHPSDAANIVSGLLARSGALRVDGGQVVAEDWLAAASVDLSTAIGQQKYANIISGVTPSPAISLADDRAAANVIRGLEELGQPTRDQAVAAMQASVAELNQVAALCRDLTGSLSAIQGNVNGVSATAQLVDQLNRTAAVSGGGGDAAAQAAAAVPVLREELNRHFSEQAATLRAATQYAPGIAGVAAGLSEGSLQEKLAQAGRIDAESEALAAELDRLEQELDRLDPEAAMRRFATLAAALNGMVAGTEDAIARVQDVVPDAVDVVYEATEPVAAPIPMRVRSTRAAAPSV